MTSDFYLPDLTGKTVINKGRPKGRISNPDDQLNLICDLHAEAPRLSAIFSVIFFVDPVLLSFLVDLQRFLLFSFKVRYACFPST